MIYLDWAATAKPRTEILQKALEKSFLYYGNPSSPHQAGSAAKEQLELCRSRCAELLDAPKESIYFTSGGSESNSIILLSFLKKHGAGELITSSIEHPSIKEPISVLEKFGWKTRKINPSTEGLFPLKKIDKALNEKTKLVSLIYVHNETGVVEPINDIVKLIREREQEFNTKIHIHIDGVQAVCKTPLTIKEMDIDSFSISGHKFGAPRGIGICYLKKERDVLIRGGGQEKGFRSGTENLYGIMAITDALEESLNSYKNRNSQLEVLMESIITRVRSFGISTIPKEREPRDSNFIPNIVSLTAPPVPGEVLVRVMNEKGFALSTGSACSNNKKSDTKGILSMGITKEEGFSSFRVSLGFDTTQEEVEQFLTALEETIKVLAP